MKIKSFVTTQKDRFTSNFNKTSLAKTKENVADSINTPARALKMYSAIQNKNDSLEARTQAHQVAYFKKVLLSAGADKVTTEKMANIFFSPTLRLGAKLDLSNISLDHVGLSAAQAANIFNKLIDSTLAGPQLRQTFEAQKSNHMAEVMRVMELSGNEMAAQVAGRNRLEQINMYTVAANPIKAGAAQMLGEWVMQKVDISTDRSGVLSVQLRGSAFRDLTDRDPKLNKPSLQVVDLFEQQVAVTKQKVGMRYDQVGKVLIEAKRDLLQSSANMVGSLAAASRPVAAVAATPVLAGIGSAGAVAAGTAAAVAAAVAPVWAVGAILADGISGGPGLAARSKNIAKGNDVRKHLGVPSKQTVGVAGAKLGSMFKDFGKGFSKGR